MVWVRMSVGPNLGPNALLIFYFILFFFFLGGGGGGLFCTSQRPCVVDLKFSNNIFGGLLFVLKEICCGPQVF